MPIAADIKRGPEGLCRFFESSIPYCRLPHREARGRALAGGRRKAQSGLTVSLSTIKLRSRKHPLPPPSSTRLTIKTQYIFNLNASRFLVVDIGVISEDQASRG